MPEGGTKICLTETRTLLYVVPPRAILRMYCTVLAGPPQSCSCASSASCAFTTVTMVCWGTSCSSDAPRALPWWEGAMVELLSTCVGAMVGGGPLHQRDLRRLRHNLCELQHTASSEVDSYPCPSGCMQGMQVFVPSNLVVMVKRSDLDRGTKINGSSPKRTRIHNERPSLLLTREPLPSTPTAVIHSLLW